MTLRTRLLSLLLTLIAGSARALMLVEYDVDGTEIIPSRETPVPVPVRRAAQEVRAKEDQTPAALRWMLQPIKRGMFVRLPVVDTDPNRGITYGIMPIIVLQGKNDDRIKQIHAPSLTYNEDFGFSPTYRYYYYPAMDAAFVGRMSRSKFEHEVMLEYVDHSLGSTPYDMLARFQKNRDAGPRFFGFGPDSLASNETNYVQDYWQYNLGFGVPLGQGSPIRAHLSQRYMSSRILNGPLTSLPTFVSVFPQQYSNHAKQTNESRVALDYDTRDHAVTTSRGVYAQVFAEASLRGYLSQFDYERYGTEGRWFATLPEHPEQVFAVQCRYEQILGPNPPFWIMPSLGGKYSLRAYGDGRYVDRGTATLNVEDRIKLYEARTAGIMTEFQLAPFVGVGSVFDTPQEAAAKSVRPVFGAAIRAVARPQVVGSVDFGIGREGLAVFTDINYSF